MEKITKNVTILFKNGTKEFFNAVSIHKTGLYVGFMKINNKHSKFIDNRFIPNSHIKKIIVRKNEKNFEIDLKNIEEDIGK